MTAPANFIKDAEEREWLDLKAQSRDDEDTDDGDDEDRDDTNTDTDTDGELIPGCYELCISPTSRRSGSVLIICVSTGSLVNIWPVLPPP